MTKKKRKTEELRRLRIPGAPLRFRRFDLTVLMVGIVILLVSLLAVGHPYKLDRADPYGFLIWFLLLLGHLPMEIIEFCAQLAGVEGKSIDNFTRNREALLLGACNLFVLLTCWITLKFYVLKRYGTAPLRIAVMFLRLIFFWGIFQLFCFAAVKNWSDGKVNPLHRDLKKTQPEAVQKKNFSSRE